MSTDFQSNSIAPLDFEENRPPLWRRALKRGLVMTVSVVIGFCLFIVLYLLLYQRKMIYFPRRYEPIEAKGLPTGGVEMAFYTSQGRQVAFYVPPRSKPDGAPDRLWVLFNGNASSALDWLDLVEKARRGSGSVGYLLVDYPGYGLCEGKPSRAAIDESSEAAFRALAVRLGVEPSTLDARLNVLGYSLGTGAGLEFAASHPVRRVILMAPFTSALAMARRTVGWPLCYLLIDRFDNRARLAELAGRPDPPRVDIFHGQADEIVPFAMGRDLAEEFPSMIALHPVSGADHNFLPLAAEDPIVALISEPNHDPAE